VSEIVLEIQRLLQKRGNKTSMWEDEFRLAVSGFQVTCGYVDDSVHRYPSVICALFAYICV
jgi:hypothetical protein